MGTRNDTHVHDDTGPSDSLHGETSPAAHGPSCSLAFAYRRGQLGRYVLCRLCDGDPGKLGEFIVQTEDREDHHSDGHEAERVPRESHTKAGEQNENLNEGRQAFQRAKLVSKRLSVCATPHVDAQPCRLRVLTHTSIGKERRALCRLICVCQQPYVVRPVVIYIALDARMKPR